MLCVVVLCECQFLFVMFGLCDDVQSDVLCKVKLSEVDFGVVIGLLMVVDFVCELLMIDLFCFVVCVDYLFVVWVEVLWMVLDGECFVLFDYVLGSWLLIDVVLVMYCVNVMVMQEFGYLVIVFGLVEVGVGVSVQLWLLLLLFVGLMFVVWLFMLCIECIVELVCCCDWLLLFVVQVIWEFVWQMLVRVEDFD